MKIEIIDKEHFVIYYSLILDDILEYEVEDIKIFIKMLVLRLRKKYHIALKGYYHLDVYIKKMIILEFTQIDEYEEEVDLNIMIHMTTPILVGFSDYFLIPGKKYFFEGQYYVPIEEINYEKYVEFVHLVYNKEAKKILECAKIL